MASSNHAVLSFLKGNVLKDGHAIRAFGFPDIHWSDRDPVALAVAQAAQRAFAPHVTVIGGDLHNCGPFTRHTRNTLKEDEDYGLIKTELEPAGKFLDEVQKYTKKETVVLEGNHDQWIERWIVSSGSVGMALRELMPSQWHRRTGSNRDEKRKNFKWIPYAPLGTERMSAYKLHPQLVTVHGWCAPKYAAQHHLDKAKDISVIYHHTHRADWRVSRLWNGNRLVQAWSAGCLCRLVPIYAHGGSPTDWNHGFWVAYIGKRSFTVYPVTIEKNYAVMPDGTEIKV